MSPLAKCNQEVRQRWLWLALFACTVIMWLYPVAYRLGRLCLLVATSVLVVWGLYLESRHRVVIGTLTGVCVLAFALVCLPGRSGDTSALRQAYVDALLAYEGTHYVWGGENRFGIDCSGLVRKGLILANARVGVQTMNPKLLRQAASLWWHDCTAKALGEEHLGLTVRLSKAASINTVDPNALTPGDLAVTANGMHVLAFLGNGLWIEADPGEMKVLRVKVPSNNPWFSAPVQLVRWCQLM